MAQTLQALYRNEGESLDFTAPAAITGGEVFQLPDGRAAVCPVDLASGAVGAASVCGVYRVLKTASIVMLRGMPVYWDHSANKANFEAVNDRDFFMGVVAADAAGSDTTVDVILNIRPRWVLDALSGEGGNLSVPTGTKAAGAFGYPKPLGQSLYLELTSTNEAQCIDVLTVDRRAVSANMIVQAIFRIPTNGSSVVDFNIGVANGTSTTDADAITESVFCHVDGGSTNLNLESDDGTTEVSATDSTVDFTAGSAVANRVEVWFDLRNPSDIQIYIDGILMLGSTVFTLAAATGPLGLLAHLEKTSSTETCVVVIDALRALTCED